MSSAAVRTGVGSGKTSRSERHPYQNPDSPSTIVIARSIPEKLGLGFARIDGGPADFIGVNIRAATGERRGDGKAGLKASGLLMVDGVLYLWARNAGNARLAWPNDRGATWQWA